MKNLKIYIFLFFLVMPLWGKTFYVSKKANNLHSVLRIASIGDSIIFTDNEIYDINLDEVKKGVLFFNSIGSNAVLNFYSQVEFQIDPSSTGISFDGYSGFWMCNLSEQQFCNIHAYPGTGNDFPGTNTISSERIFMAFDLANLPAGNITNASLNLYNYRNIDKYNSSYENSIYIQIRNYTGQYNGNGFTENDFYNVGNEIFSHENFYNYEGASDKQLITFELNTNGINYIKGSSVNSLSRLASNWKVFVFGFDVDFEGTAQSSSYFYFYTSGNYTPFLKIVYTPLQILSPTANDRWRCGGTYDIRWAKNSLNKPQIANDIKILYTLNRGEYYVLIDSTDSDLGSYSWTIPDNLVSEENGNCAIKLVYTDQSGNSSEVVSEFFTIIPNEPELMLISPNGGEVYSEGDNIKIKWNYNKPTALNKIVNNLDSVFISFSLDNGNTFELIDSCDINGPNGDTSYTWSIPEGLVQDNFNDQCIIKISSEYNGQLFEDISDNSFTIYKQKSITLIKPEDNEIIIKSEEPYLIRWDYTGNISKVRLRYKKGAIWQTIGDFPGADKQYEWNIPASLSGSTDIIIYDKDEPTISDTANNVIFTEQITFNIIYPTKNDTLYIGQEDSIKWSTVGSCDFVDIRFNSGTYTKLYPNIPNIGLFKYIVPDDIPEGNAFFKISATFDASFYSLSDTFTVLNKGIIEVSDNQIDFGEISYPECSTYVFYIFNNSLENADISVIHAPASPFDIEVNEGELPSGDTLQCKAIFCPQTEGAFIDSILILAGQDTLKIYLSGIGDILFPTFVNYPQVRCITDNSVIIHWRVNYPINFLFYLSDNQDNLFNTVPDTIEYIEEMLYAIENLEPGVEYYFNIVPFVNENIQFPNNLIFSFTTLKKFIEKNIQFVEKPHLEYISDNMAIVSFKTDFPVIGALKMGEEEYIENTSSFIHRFILENLMPSTRYIYEVGVKNNEDIYYYPSSYTFKTLEKADNQAPTLITGPSVSVSDNKASIRFEADESCIAILELFQSYDPDKVDTLIDSTYSKKHIIMAIDLEPGESYTFYITLRDLSGNEYRWTGSPTLLSKILNIAGGNNNFNTNQNADNTPPEFINPPIPIALYDSLFVLMYQSNEQTIYDMYVYDQNDNPVSYLSNDEYNYVQKIVVPRLEPAMTYKLKLVIKDISNNDNTYDDILIKTRKTNIPLKAKEVVINQPYITDDFILLSWTTDVYGDSRSLIDENQNLDDSWEVVSTDIDLQHILVIKNLDKTKSYFYKLFSKDFYDQTLYESDTQQLEYIVNNEELNFVEEPEVIYTNYNHVLIGWETNLLSSTVIEYYTEDEENKIVSVNESLTKKHRISIFNIDSTEVYHIKAISYTIDDQKIEKNLDIDMKTLNFEDNVPPPAPEYVTAELDSNLRIKIEWSKVNVEDLKGYNIYRQIGDTEKLELLVKNFNGDKFLDDDLKENSGYLYGVSAVDFANNESEITFIENPVVRISDKENIFDKNIAVFAYPNPFSGEIRIQIQSFIEDKLELVIYNIIGERIILEKNISIENGEKIFKTYNLSNFPSGVYFYKIYSKKTQKIISGKIVLLK